MEHTFILDTITFAPDLPALMQRLHVKENSSHAQDLKALVDEAAAIARPKAMYRLAYIDEKAEDCVVIEGVTFTSRVLRVNLDIAQRVFAYVATCGMELEAWEKSLKDMLYSFWADVIKEMALRAAAHALNHELATCYTLGRTSTMAPGSLPDWPIREQRPLFTLLGDPQAAIGVQLTDSMLMVPNKSISGIRFPTEENFESCQLCPRENCPGRRAPYDATLYERKYHH